MDLDLSLGGRIDSAAGKVYDSLDRVVDIDTFLVPAPTDGVPVLVIIADHVRLGAVTIGDELVMNNNDKPAVAIVARHAISVEGIVRLRTGGESDAYDQSKPCYAGVAGSKDADRFGGAGGAFGTGGGTQIPSPDSSPVGNAELIPLRGGCGGGGIDDLTTHALGPPPGGGIQLSSDVAIRFLDSSRIDANGFGGYTLNGFVTGGASGGGVLIEAPEVTLGVQVRLLAGGGAAPAGDSPAGSLVSGTDDGSPAVGLTCAATSMNCGNGGNGATAQTMATGASHVDFNTATAARAGGGGGGAGRIRINSKASTFTPPTDAIVSGVLTTGVVVPR